MRNYIAFVDAGEPVLLHGLIALVPDTEQLNLAPVSVRTKTLIAGRDVVDVSAPELAGLLAQIAKNPLVMRINDADLTIGDGHPTSARIHYFPTNHPRFQGPARIPGLVIRHGGPIGSRPHRLPPELVPQIELELAAYQEPFGGMADVVQSLGLPQDVLADNHAASIEIIAAAPAAITNTSHIIDGKALVEVRCARGISHEMLRVGLRGFARGHENIMRLTIGPSQIEWSATETHETARASVTVHDVSLAQLFLIYGDEPIFSSYVSDPNRSFNPAYDLYTIVDESKLLLSSLTSVRGNEFQNLVALFLQLIGLSVLNIGTVLTDGPDLFAMSSANDLYVVECSAGDPDHKGKLLKLHLRTKSVKEACQLRGIAFRNVQPVIVTNLPKADTNASWERAAGFGIALVCREQLEQIFERAPAPPTADQLNQAVMTCIPSQKNLDAKLF